MWLAKVTSCDHTSYCHFCRPITPQRTFPECTPTRMLISTPVASLTFLKKKEIYFTIQEQPLLPLTLGQFSGHLIIQNFSDCWKYCHEFFCSRRLLPWARKWFFFLITRLHPLLPPSSPTCPLVIIILLSKCLWGFYLIPSTLLPNPPNPFLLTAVKNTLGHCLQLINRDKWKISFKGKWQCLAVLIYFCQLSTLTN